MTKGVGKIMKNAVALAVAFIVSAMSAPLARSLDAQPVEEQMERGDRAAAAMNPAEALTHYDSVLTLDSLNFEALWKFSMNAVDVGEFEADKKKREALYRRAEETAKRAVAINSRDADAQFHLARALGMAALAVGVKERIVYARDVRLHALEALKLNPRHPGALHVLGVWNAEVMRLSGIERTLAKAFMGAHFFSDANWEDAIRYMEEAVAVDPDRLTHHLDLARIYRDRKMIPKAKLSYQRVIDGAPTHVNDKRYKEQAAAELARLR